MKSPNWFVQSASRFFKLHHWVDLFSRYRWDSTLGAIVIMDPALAVN